MQKSHFSGTICPTNFSMKKTFLQDKIKGKNIFSILTEPKKTQKKLVIMSHGFRGTSVGPARSFVNFTKVLVENGFSTLRFDQPNSGNSDGDFLEVSFKEWVETITYLAQKYIKSGYSVALLGQSMGATASMIASGAPGLKSKIPCVLLWVPDPESDFVDKGDIYAEEGGEKYPMSFWKEASELDFFSCLDKYSGRVHLVYGEFDRYVSESLRKKTIKKVKGKGDIVMSLEGQDHSPWEFELSQKVYDAEITFLKENLS